MLASKGNRGKRNRNEPRQDYEGILSGIPDPCFAVDKDLTITYFNDAAQRFTGWKAEEVVGQSTCRELFKSDICESSCAIRACMASGQSTTGTRVVVKDRWGKEAVVSASANLLTDANGEVIGGIEVIHDISQQLELEASIRAKEEYANSIIKGISDPFFVADGDLLVTYMNQACADLTGYSIDETVNKCTCREIFKSNICETGCALKSCMATGDVISGARVVMENRAGVKIPIEASAGSIRNEQGEVIGGFEICRDISAVVETERDLQRAAEETSGAGEELAASTEQMSANIQELTSIISVVIERSEQMAKGADTSLSSVQQGYERVGNAVDAMDGIKDASLDAENRVQELTAAAEKITGILKVIDEIAGQTNLLALNAAIEAARAGEHGRGFEVVAGEVGSLASNAKTSTQEIAGIVDGIAATVDRVAGVGQTD